MSNPQKDLTFALDIGTRSVVGIVGESRGEMFHVLHMAREEHSKRAMLDGQIEDIDQVAKIVRIVKERLEEQVGFPLSRVCVAAAGRSLRMERARAVVELPKIHTIDDDLISQLEAVAIADAEEKLSEHNKEQRFFLVGYTVAQYILDRYPMTTIKGHNGQLMEADVVATFLPSQVVEGLYSVVQLAGLEVASLTLEPIAALNATIPPDLRLLNLVLVDIGAGTSDIAVCRDGSVVGYTMATTAGDEITEMLMKHFLIDFATAENLKTNLYTDSIKFTDVLGLEQIASGQQIRDAIEPASKTLVKEIAKQILAINGCAPSAVFMAGGGSKLEGITEQLAVVLEVEPRRIAVVGNNYNRTIVAENFQLDDPEYATPLGIAVSAGLGLINDSYHITLNGKGAKLFRSGSLTILDILMMNGYTAASLIGRTGSNLAIMINGNKKIIRGKPAIPGILRLNGEAAVASTVVRAADVIDFVPAIDGLSATSSLKEFLGDYSGRVLLNGQEVDWDTQLRSGDSITTLTEGGASVPVVHSRRTPRSLTEEELTPVPLDEDGNPMYPSSFYHQEKAQPSAPVQVEPPLGEQPPSAPELFSTVHEESQTPRAAVVDFSPEIPMQSPAREPAISAPSAGESAPVEEDEVPRNGPLVFIEEGQAVAPEGDLGLQEVSSLPARADFPEDDVKIYGQETSNPEADTPPPIAPPASSPPSATAQEIPAPELSQDATMTQADFTRQSAFAQPSDFTGLNLSQEDYDTQAFQKLTSELPSSVLLEAAYENPEEAPQPTETLPDFSQGIPPIQTEFARQEPQNAPEPSPAPDLSGEGFAPAVEDTGPKGDVTLNGKPLFLTPKPDGSPYYLMDLLDKTDIDFRRASRPIRTLVNGSEGFFVQQIFPGDEILIEEQN